MGKQYTGFHGRYSNGEKYDKNRSRNKNRRKARGKRSRVQRTRHAVERYHQLEKSLDDLGGDYESTGVLFEKIEQHPEIWNSKSDSMTSDIICYYDGQRRKEAWISICRSINVGFDEKNSEEKAEICQVVMEKWRNIRNCYARFVEKEKYLGKNISSGKLSIYAKNLSFLSLISKAQSSFEDKVLPEDFDIVETDEAKISEAPVTVSEIKTVQDDCYYHNSSEMFEYVEIKPELEGTKSLASETDSVMDFLKSLHPLIKDFNDDQKLKFQCETLSIIEQIRETRDQNIHDSSKYLKHGISFSFYSPGNLTLAVKNCNI